MVQSLDSALTMSLFINQLKIKTMVKITGYKEVETKAGKQFFMLEVSDGVELAISKAGNPYLTEKRAYISSTFDEDKCKDVQGMKLPGSILREECEQYSYVNAKGDLVSLNHRYVYHADVVSEEKTKQTSEQEEFELA